MDLNGMNFEIPRVLSRHVVVLSTADADRYYEVAHSSCERNIEELPSVSF